MNKLLIKVTGKNIRNFLIKLDQNKIDALSIKIINNNEVLILIKKIDVEILNKIKGIFEYEVIKEYGYNKKILKNNIHLFIILVVNLIFIFFLTNYIYEIDIISDNHKLKNLVLEKLSEKGIKKYSKKVSNLDEIKNQILSENKDSLEWIEIIPSGVKYEVKVEERIKNNAIKNEKPTNIIAKKAGVIKKVIASNGKVLVEKDTFVKKGDTLITGVINEEKFIHSSGEVYAEVFYKTKVDILLHEYENKLTNNEKKGLRIRFFSKDFALYKKYQNNEVNEKIIFKNSIIPFYLSFDHIKEKVLVDNILTVEEAIDKALIKARTTINNKLKENEKIISEKQLKLEVKNSKIIVEILFITYENIALEERIEVSNVPGDNQNSN